MEVRVMSKATENFIRQHHEILGMAGEISGLLKADLTLEDAAKIRNLLSNLAGKVSIHLAMEDNGLYPRLKESKDPAVQKTTLEFIREMGDIMEKFKAYSDRWPIPRSIHESPVRFIGETKLIFDALQNRIERENTILYPLLP
jgi:iron-sulfur cluster repair protein YtfE (RIC family)